jgi:CheY-like chemotaxis protein
MPRNNRSDDVLDKLAPDINLILFDLVMSEMDGIRSIALMAGSADPADWYLEVYRIASSQISARLSSKQVHLRWLPGRIGRDLHVRSSWI